MQGIILLSHTQTILDWADYTLTDSELSELYTAFNNLMDVLTEYIEFEKIVKTVQTQSIYCSSLDSVIEITIGDRYMFIDQQIDVSPEVNAMVVWYQKYKDVTGVQLYDIIE